MASASATDESTSQVQSSTQDGEQALSHSGNDKKREHHSHHAHRHQHHHHQTHHSPRSSPRDESKEIKDGDNSSTKNESYVGLNILQSAIDLAPLQQPLLAPTLSPHNPSPRNLSLSPRNLSPLSPRNLSPHQSPRRRSGSRSLVGSAHDGTHSPRNSIDEDSMDVEVQPNPPARPLLPGDLGAKDFDMLVENTQRFTPPIPTRSNLIQSIAEDHKKIQDTIVGHARGTRIIVPRGVKHLIEAFLHFKLSHGTDIEKRLYIGMTPNEFAFRLIKMRPLVFYTAGDYTLLRDGSKPNPRLWGTVASNDDSKAITLENYLSYDEMQISALLVLSSQTYFINDGATFSLRPGTYQKQGVYCAVVGARFERFEYMESQHILITKHNSVECGYGEEASKDEKNLKRLWIKFYHPKPNPESSSEYFPTVDELDALDKSGKLPARYAVERNYDGTIHHFFDTVVYRQRIKLSLDAFLFDCNLRGLEASKKAYVHLVGLGLGVWEINSVQGAILVDAVGDLLNTRTYPNISDIDFSWFPASVTSCLNVSHGEVFTGHGNEVRILFSKRNPADLLSGDNEGKLLTASYAWDSNAFVGNEYWMGSLSASGDPAAACCSTIPQIQNPYINTFLSPASVRFIDDH